MKIENNISQLDELTKELESEDLDLDTALDKYSKAIKLAAKTLEELKKAEDKLSVLQNEAGEVMEISCEGGTIDSDRL
ncbi:exodeoxyribonuclease VII small subunit [Thermoproteota archaeon]